jgi:hypothetical protein
VRRTRGNRLADSTLCLWKQGEKLRYYDIVGQDYTELFETINLSQFSNIEISTLKFFEDFPELMEKYDIRDQYELHNLLKKIIDVKDYNDISDDLVKLKTALKRIEGKLKDNQSYRRKSTIIAQGTKKSGAQLKMETYLATIGLHLEDNE